MNLGKRDFDKEAATWDTPPRVKLAEDVAKSILCHIPLKPDMDILDFGCGTGLVSLALCPKVRSVTGVDSSKGMLNIFQEKVSRGNIPGIKIFHLDLDKGGSLPGLYNVIVTNMTMHHIKDVKSFLNKLTGAILPGGYLVVADLDLDGGLFHSNHDGVYHHGFERANLRRMFLELGLDDIHDFTAAEIVKPIADGSMHNFSIFLIAGRKM